MTDRAAGAGPGPVPRQGCLQDAALSPSAILGRSRAWGPARGRTRAWPAAASSARSGPAAPAGAPGPREALPAAGAAPSRRPGSLLGAPRGPRNLPCGPQVGEHVRGAAEAPLPRCAPSRSTLSEGSRTCGGGGQKPPRRGGGTGLPPPEGAASTAAPLAFPPSCPAPRSFASGCSGSRAGRTTSGSGRPRRYPGATAIGTYRSHQKGLGRLRRRDRASRDPRRKGGVARPLQELLPAAGRSVRPGPQSQIGMNGRAAGC